MRLIQGEAYACRKPTVRAGPRWHGPSNSELVQRLWNWARWAADDPDVPCVAMSSVWQEWNPYGKGREEGWGDAEGVPVADGYDEVDAEIMDGWVRQLPREPRILIVRRFVLWQRVGWAELDPAVRALADLMEANRAVVERMR